jgi:hypothetical protein
MAQGKTTRRQKDISRLLKERINIRKDKIRKSKPKDKPGR